MLFVFNTLVSFAEHNTIHFHVFTTNVIMSFSSCIKESTLNKHIVLLLFIHHLVDDQTGHMDVLAVVNGAALNTVESCVEPRL